MHEESSQEHSINPKSELTKIDVLLSAQSITKAYPGTLALDKVNFNVYKGKVTALVGENGAGKSTLMKILAGVERISSGTLLLNNKEVTFTSPQDAMNHGIGIIYQELDLCANLSVKDNIFLSRELSKWGSIDTEQQWKRSRELLDRLEHNIDPNVAVGELRVGEQQIVAIAKALAQNVQILIMDEPTSSLSPAEVQILFKVMKELREQGISIVYISHKLDEILEICDFISVLRDGHNVATERIENVDLKWIVEKMIGRNQSELFSRTQSYVTENILLKVENLALPRTSGGFLVDHISFNLHEGEVLGLFGLMGAGRTELLECLSGACRYSTGNLVLHETHLDRNTITDRIQDGIFLVPEDRQKDGLVASLSVQNNMVLSSLDNFFHRTKLFLEKKKESKAVHEKIKSLSIKVANPDQPISSLSGGNQQKAIIAKALLTSPKVLLLDEPTRGIDVGAKSEIYEITEQLASQNFGVIFVSSELKEILTMTDRILVFSKGKITAEYKTCDVSEEILMSAAVSELV